MSQGFYSEIVPQAPELLALKSIANSKAICSGQPTMV